LTDPTMKFIGIDLGWSSGASGVCCLQWIGQHLELLEITRQNQHSDILTWIDDWLPIPQPGLIAVDAPTLIPNPTGSRLPDRLAHQFFHRYHAGCYPANLNLPFAVHTVAFGLNLEARGFQHAPAIVPQQLGRFQIEAFPHPAIVHLFQLERILKYKKGRLAERKLELAKLQHYIMEILPTLEPRLSLATLPPAPFQTDLSPLSSTALKAIEDQLDSLICAYIAAHWWYWGLKRNQVLGDRASGYIVIPKAVEGRG
jgi:predicted RNase H-like nuclease